MSQQCITITNTSPVTQYRTDRQSIKVLSVPTVASCPIMVIASPSPDGKAILGLQVIVNEARSSSGSTLGSSVGVKPDSPAVSPQLAAIQEIDSALTDTETDDEPLLIETNKQPRSQLRGLPAARRVPQRRARRKPLSRTNSNASPTKPVIPQEGQSSRVRQQGEQPQLPPQPAHQSTDHAPQAAQLRQPAQPAACPPITRRHSHTSQAKERHARPRVLSNAAAASFLELGGCAFNPIGECLRQAMGGSAYCDLHSCRAINADGGMCAALVRHPELGRFCPNGYHRETLRDHFVEELIQQRKKEDIREKDLKCLQRRDSLAYMDRYFSSAMSSISSHSTRSPDGSPKSTDASLPNESRLSRESSEGGQVRTATPGARHLTLDDAVDKWWVGKWRLSLRHDVRLPLSQ